MKQKIEDNKDKPKDRKENGEGSDKGTKNNDKENT